MRYVISDCLNKIVNLPSAQLVHDCDTCRYNNLEWDEEPCDSCTAGGESCHWKPSVQPEIIVCADCKHWKRHDRRCGYWNHGVKQLDWCCHAERRTDEQAVSE